MRTCMNASTSDCRHGLLLFDKPLGMSSNQCVQKVRRLLNINKAGHTGTLDPMATGLLPICCGKATRLAEFLLLEDKAYTAQITLGNRTDTGDVEGEVIDQAEVPSLSQSQLNTLIHQFLGAQDQQPPIYSAIKVHGQPMYSLARKQRQQPDTVLPQLQPRQIQIHTLALTLLDRTTITVEVSCSKGTYIRSLAEDIAAALGTVGHLSALERTHCGSLSLEDALNLDTLIEAASDHYKGKGWLSLEQMVAHLPHIHLSKEEQEKVANGIALPLSDSNLRGTIALLFDGALIALARIDTNARTMAPAKVFCR